MFAAFEIENLIYHKTIDTATSTRGAKKKKKRNALSMANRASGQKRESQRGERVSNLYTVLHDGDSVCRNARVWERGGTFYIGYVLGTSHEPDQSARLPLHPKERRAPGWPLNCADETANRRYVTGRETNEPSHFRVLDPPSGDGTKTGARNRRRLKTGWNVDGSERGRNP